MDLLGVVLSALGLTVLLSFAAWALPRLFAEKHEADKNASKK